MTRNDVLWKGLIEDIFPYFIPFFLPQYQHLFDLTQPIEFLDKELQQLYPEPADYQDIRFVDKLVKLRTVEGEEKWVLIHIEVQGYSDSNFSQRMFSYFYRILDRYGIPVTALAIFTDGSASFHPDQYSYQFAGSTMVYHFNVYKVLQQDEYLLAESNNPFAIAILTVLLSLKKKKLEDESLLRLKIELVQQLRSKGFAEGIIRSLLDFIRLYVNFAKPETDAKFETALEPFTNNSNNMTTHEIALELMKQQAIKWGKAEASQSTLR